MSIIKKIVNGISGKDNEFKAKLKQAQEDARIQKIVDQRLKSSNERELEAHMERLREDDIKKKLDQIHKQQTKENWSGKHKILAGKTNIMKTDRPILKEKNIFKHNNNSGGMRMDMGFFK